MAVDLPEYLTDQTQEVILQRMLDALPADLDRSEGSFLWDALSPASIEMALAAIWAQQILERGFASTTFGAYLDLRAEEHGLTRIPSQKATGQVTFTGTAGTVVAAGTQVSTAATDTTPAQLFETTADVTLVSGTGTVAIKAIEPGSAGNVGAGTITFMVAPVAGVTSVTNAAATSGGAEEETDAALLTRYLTKVRNPSAGGNRADYVNWALEVAGVGGVSVVPVRDGPGTVSVAIIGTDKRPASQPLVDAVQDYIAPPHVLEAEAEAMTLGGLGTSIDGTAVKMVYDAGGAGTLTHPDLETLLPQPGIWQARIDAKVDANLEVNDLLEVGVWNVSAAAWAKIAPSSSTDARQVIQADDLATEYGDIIQEFYWNGQDQLELRITRLQTDTTTTVWIDEVTYRSTFSQDTGDGKAPIGARVTVEPAVAVVINVSATLTIASGYDPTSVQAAAKQSIIDYLKSLAFQSDNDVRYVRIGNAILDTAGVQDYSGLLVNGAEDNVPIGDQQVAVDGTITLT